MSQDVFLGGGPWMVVQMTCLWPLWCVQRRRAVVGCDAVVRPHPGGFRQPGAIGSTLGTSKDMPKSTDMPFGVSGASFRCSDSSQGW